jgi:hypothetical protein
MNVKVQLPDSVHGLMRNVVYEEALLWSCMHLLRSWRVAIENQMLFWNKYGLKKPGDFTVFKGHEYPLRLTRLSYKMKTWNLGLHVGFYFAISVQWGSFYWGMPNVTVRWNLLCRFRG